MIYIPNTVSGDGEEIDCYILGVNEPIEEFEGECIAVIHRINDNDDKLIVVPKGKKYTDKQILELTNFQEKYFESEVIR
ncbi:MAG: inorganic diphosphatase [Clostridia bacterium]